MKKKPTYHAGATAERSAWMRKVRDLIKRDPVHISIFALEKFGEDRVARFQKKKGGL